MAVSPIINKWRADYILFLETELIIIKVNKYILVNLINFKNSIFKYPITFETL